MTKSNTESKTDKTSAPATKIKTKNTKKSVTVSAEIDGKTLTVKTTRKCVSTQKPGKGACKACMKKSPDLYKICAVKTAAKLAEVKAVKNAEIAKTAKAKSDLDAAVATEKAAASKTDKTAATGNKIDKKKTAVKSGNSKKSSLAAGVNSDMMAAVEMILNHPLMERKKMVETLVASGTKSAGGWKTMVGALALAKKHLEGAGSGKGAYHWAAVAIRDEAMSSFGDIKKFVASKEDKTEGAVGRSVQYVFNMDRALTQIATTEVKAEVETKAVAVVKAEKVAK